MREIAATIGAIPWELLCRIGSRIERVYAGGARRRAARIEPWPPRRPRRPSSPARSAAPSRRSGWAAAPSAAPGTRLVEERGAAAGRGRRDRGRATRRRRSGPGRSATAQRYADVSLAPSTASRPASPSSIACSAAASCPGSLVLLGGEPGIGKSTLLLQAAAHFAARTSGRCSTPRARRASRRSRRAASGSASATIRCYLFAETCLERVLDEAVRLKPALLVLDSIQTVFSTKLQSAPGSVAQVREAATQLLFAAKGQHVPTFIIGHVTKDGALAGPKVLEHVVDTVLYFEGERHHAHRVVRAVKNRFGAASEVGVFEMTGAGLQPVPNPSALFLAERPARVAGSAVLCAIEGSRPLLVEVQALVSTSTYGYAKRTANGLDANRVSLLLAVLEKRAGLVMSGDDVFANVAGGLSVDEPAVDLAVVAALASSLRNRPVPRIDGALRRGRPRRRGAPRDARRAARPRGGAPRLHPRDPAARQRRQGRRPGRRHARRRSPASASCSTRCSNRLRTTMPPFHWWRTVFFLIPAIAVYTTVLGTISLASSFFDRSGRFAHKCARAWSWLILKTTGVTVERHAASSACRAARATSSPPTTRASTTSRCCSGRSTSSCASWPRRRSASFPFLGWHLARTGHVLVDRKNPGADLFRQVRTLMQAGYSLFVFPEGHAQPRRLAVALPRRHLHDGDRVRPAGGAGGDRRQPLRDAQGPADDVARATSASPCSIRFRRPGARPTRPAPSPARCRTRSPARSAPGGPEARSASEAVSA